MQRTIHPLDSLPDDTSEGRAGEAFDWGGQVRLAVVLSTAAAIVGIGLGRRLPEEAFVLGSIVVSSVLAWRRVDERHV